MLTLLFAEIGNTWALPFETDFIIWLQSLGGKGSFIYYLMNFITMFGEEFVLVGIMGLIYWGLDKRKGEKIGFMLIFATVANPLIKNIVRRTRPFDSASGIENLRDVGGYSFPSGHSSGSASLFIGCAVTYRKTMKKWMTALCIIIPLLVALSRNYLGAHYLTDVVAGLALGVILVFLIDLLLRKLNKYIVYAGALVLGAAGFFYCTTSDFFTGYGILFGFVFAVLFEEKVTKFKNTRCWWRIALRVAAGGALFLGLNELLKLPFNSVIYTYTADGTKIMKDGMETFERIFRTVRYTVVTFTCMGIYPLIFAPFEKLWNRLSLNREGAVSVHDDNVANQENTENSQNQDNDIA